MGYAMVPQFRSGNPFPWLWALSWVVPPWLEMYLCSSGVVPPCLWVVVDDSLGLFPSLVLASCLITCSTWVTCSDGFVLSPWVFMAQWLVGPWFGCIAHVLSGSEGETTSLKCHCPDYP